MLDLELKLLLVVGIVGRRTRPLPRFLAPDFGLDDPLKLDSPHLGFRVSGSGSVSVQVSAFGLQVTGFEFRAEFRVQFRV